MTSLKTTIAGLFGAVGAYLMTQGDSALIVMVGTMVNALSIFLMGLSSRDNGVTSEKAGAN